jgi:hypothetical protein
MTLLSRMQPPSHATADLPAFVTRQIRRLIHHPPSNNITGHIRAKVWDQFVHGLLSERLLRGSGIRLEDDPTRIGGSGDQPRVRPTECKTSASLDWPLSLRLPRAHCLRSSLTLRRTAEAPRLHPPALFDLSEWNQEWVASIYRFYVVLSRGNLLRQVFSNSAYRFLDPQNRESIDKIKPKPVASVQVLHERTTAKTKNRVCELKGNSIDAVDIQGSNTSPKTPDARGGR